MNTVKPQKRNLWLIFATFFALIIGLLTLARTANADVTTNVLDNANVMSARDIQKINDINDYDLAKIKGHPQIAVITERDVDDIEDFAQNQFEKYHFGRKGLDNGILIVISVDTHKIRIQTGYGVEGAVPDVWAGSDAVDGTPKEDFRNGDYGAGIVVIVRRVANKLAQEESSIKSKGQIVAGKRAEAEQQEQERQAEVAFFTTVKYIIIAIIAIIFFAAIAYVLYMRAQDKKVDKFLDNILNSKACQKYHFTRTDFDNATNTHYTYFVGEMMEREPFASDFELDGGIFVLERELICLQNDSDGQIMCLKMNQYRDLIKRVGLDTAVKNAKDLHAHLDSVLKDFDKRADERTLDTYDKILSTNLDIYDKNNLSELTKYRYKALRKTSKKYNWFDVLQNFVWLKLLGQNATFDSVMTDDDDDLLYSQLVKIIQHEDTKLTLNKVDGEKNVNKAINKTHYNLNQAYKHLSKDQQKEFVKDVDASDLAAAGLILATAMFAMDEARRERDRQRRLEEEQRRRDNNDDDNHWFDGGGGFFDGGSGGGFFDGGSGFDGGDFGGFGGDSGGGGATSGW